jgi:hypothetical protein
MRLRWFHLLLSLLAAASALCAQDGGAIPLEYNRDIRPILSDRCYFCHGPDSSNRKTKLRLDREEDAKADLGKGRYGIVPGDPERSEIYKRITSTSKTLRMPPSYLGHEALPARDIETIRRWIVEGAAYQPHWAFVPPVRRTPPQVDDDAGAAWAASAIDRFLLARLRKEGLRPRGETDKRTLLRRVTLDLTGLPPTPAEVDAFLADNQPRAYERVVDRLFSSPAYAERMAIRWLEAARYADTNGYQTDGPREMWKWRDWVIDAFGRNTPFDQFTVEQLAGDLLPAPTLPQQIATGFHRNHRTSAEGGIVNEEFRVEYVADRAETTGTVWLGLTVGCARCHDHKFDPIPQRDFYSLFAFFNQAPERGFVWNFGNEPPTMLAPDAAQRQRLDGLTGALAAKRHVLERERATLVAKQKAWERSLAAARPTDWQPSDGLAAHWTLDNAREEDANAKVLACAVSRAERPDCGAVEATLEVHPGRHGNALHFDGKAYLELATQPRFNYRDPFTLSVWMKPEAGEMGILSQGEDDFEGQQHGLYLLDGKVRLHSTFRWSDLGLRLETKRRVTPGEWTHLAVTYDGSMLAAGVRIYVNGERWETDVLFDQHLWPIDSKEPWRVGAAGGMRFRGLLDEVRVHQRSLSAEEAAALAVPTALNGLAAIPASQRTAMQLAKLRLGYEAEFAPAPFRRLIGEEAEAARALETFRATVPTTMVMRDAPGIRETFVLERGAYDAPGEKVTAATPSALPPMPEGLPRNRLGLARWIVSRDNPLTARVTVNRLWAMLFGTGIVKTVEDFGSQGEWPLHPELLDWLAVEFMDSGWDLKHIVKQMVMSAAYRRDSRVTPELLERDPENRLLARGPRFRLPAEMIRDQALAASGLLVEKQGGPPVKPYQPPGLWQELAGGKGYEEDDGEGLYRRSLYTYWRRTVAPPMMVNFDAATRETCVVHQVRTNTPLQALNLMNDVTFLEAARHLASRMLDRVGEGEDAALREGYYRVLAREPKAKEMEALRRALGHYQRHYAGAPGEARLFLAAGKSGLRAWPDVAQHAAYMAVASIVLNLDEAVTKE